MCIHIAACWGIDESIRADFIMHAFKTAPFIKEVIDLLLINSAIVANIQKAKFTPPLV